MKNITNESLDLALIDENILRHTAYIFNNQIRLATFNGWIRDKLKLIRLKPKTCHVSKQQICVQTNRFILIVQLKSIIVLETFK